MLQALKRYAQQNRLSSEPGFGARGVHQVVHLDAEGQFHHLEDLRHQGKPRVFEGVPKLSPVELIRGGDEVRCQFLIESAALLLKAEPLTERQQKQRQFFLSMLTQAALSVPCLDLVHRFLSDPTQLQRALEVFEGSGGNPRQHLVIAVDGKNPLTDEPWQTWWRDFYASLSPQAKLGGALDLLDGREITPLVSHPKISGLIPLGGAPTGDVLISFDKSAFTSYGLRGSANAAMSAESAAIVAGAVQHLVEGADRLAGVALTSWFEGHPGDPLAALFGRVPNPKAEAERYHLVILGANSGRVRLRSYRQGPTSLLESRVKAWQEDLKLADRQAPTLPELVSALSGPDRSEVRPVHAISLLDSILDGGPVPDAVVALAISLTAKRLTQGEEPTHPRVALLRAFLRRGGWPAPSQLDPQLEQPAYLFGRLLGGLARMYQRANDADPTHPVQGTFTLALGSPERALQSLFRLFRGRARQAPNSARLVARLAKTLPFLPPRWKGPEQALVILGYHQQLMERAR